jgi:predicted PurR-regulated permease PerM
MAVRPPTRDITRVSRAVLFIAALIAACFWILRPFLTASVWASTIVIATWPLMLRLQARLWRRRGLAVLAMTVLLLLLLIVPLSLAIATILAHADDLVGFARSLGAFAMPAPPQWLPHLPLVGVKLAHRWQELAAVGPGAVSAALAPHARAIVAWMIAGAGSLGMMIVQFLLIPSDRDRQRSALRHRGASRLRRLPFARRLAGQQGEDAAILAARAVRGVALGVVVTALIQTFLGGIGLALSHVPAATVFTAVMFMLCVAQIGPGLVFLPVVVWLFWKDQPVWGSIMIVWWLTVGSIDNFIRPLLIRKGADLPLLLIFAGVIGGLIAFGVVGLFIGPVLLAVTYTLLRAWVAEGDAADEPPAGEDARASLQHSGVQ